MLELDMHVQLKPIDRPLPLRTSSIVRATRTDLAMPTPPVSRAHRNLAAVSSFQKKNGVAVSPGTSAPQPVLTLLSFFFYVALLAQRATSRPRSEGASPCQVAASLPSVAVTYDYEDRYVQEEKVTESMNWLTSTGTFPAIIVAG